VGDVLGGGFGGLQDVFHAALAVDQDQGGALAQALGDAFQAHAASVARDAAMKPPPMTRSP